MKLCEQQFLRQHEKRCTRGAPGKCGVSTKGGEQRCANEDESLSARQLRTENSGKHFSGDSFRKNPRHGSLLRGASRAVLEVEKSHNPDVSWNEVS